MIFIYRFLVIVYSLKSFFERKIFIKNIKRNDLVLDVGSGDKPFWRADVIVDKYLEDNQQRHSGSVIRDGRKIFIEGDVEDLPFKDKVFDFVLCSHLLEHVKNPDKAILELTRVAKSGYIEVPYAILDLFEPFPPHLWFCDYRDGTLIFMQKEKNKNFFIDQTEAFGKKFYRNSILQYLLEKNNKSIFISCYWKDKIKFKVIRTRNGIYTYQHKKEINHEKGVSEKITFFIYKIIFLLMTRLFYVEKNIKLEHIQRKV